MTNREYLNQMTDEQFAFWLKNEFSLTNQDALELKKWLAEKKPIATKGRETE